MKYLALLFLFTGCIHGTSIYEGGVPVLRTNGDFTGIEFATKSGTRLKALTMTHSALITARGAALQGVIKEAAAGMASGAIKGFKP